VFAEMLGELGACTGEALADRLGLVTEDLGDLGGLETFDADEQGDLAIRGCEGGERALEGELRLGVGECLEGRARGSRGL